MNPTLAQAPMSRDAIRGLIFDHDDIPSRLVVVPEWGDVKLEMRGLSVQDQNEHFQRMAAADSDKATEREKWLRMFPTMLSATTYVPYFLDDTWQPKASKETVFDGDKDAAALITRSAVAMGRLTKVALILSGLREEDEDEDDKAAQDEAIGE